MVWWGKASSETEGQGSQGTAWHLRRVPWAVQFPWGGWVFGVVSVRSPRFELPVSRAWGGERGRAVFQKHANTPPKKQLGKTSVCRERTFGAQGLRGWSSEVCLFQ